MSLSGPYKQLLFKISSRFPSVYALFYKLFYHPAQGSLVQIISQFSKNNPGLYVLQVGANDGFNHDPIHKFIRRDKWKGILTEPQKDVFENKLSRLHRYTRDIICIHAALDNSDGERPLFKIAFSNARWATGLSSFNKSALLEAIETGHVERAAKKEGIIPPSRRSEWLKTEFVKTISPGTLKSEFGLKNIDFLQIDTEGFDFEIIKIVSASGFKPRMIVFEHSHLSANEKMVCFDFLKQKNYLTREIGGNAVAINMNEQGYEAFFIQ